MAWYLGGVGSWFFGTGVQSTFYPWLVAVELEASELAVGLAQAASSLPVLFLMLVGGAYADRHDGRRVLVVLHALAAVPPLALAAAIGAGYGSLPAAVAYAVSMGVLSAFVIPARESLLSRVVDGPVQRAVALSIAVQNLLSAAGAVVAGTASRVGAASVLTAQAFAFACGAIACWRLEPAPPLHAKKGGGQLGEIRDGLRELVASPKLLTVTALSVAIGVLFLGPFLVALPLLVRDRYAGSSPEIAAINIAMLLGMLLGAASLFARGGVRRPGRAFVVSLLTGSAALGAVATDLPLLAVYACIFLFGLSGGVATPAGRSLVQETAPPSHRARILSAYSLGFLGAAPFGAFLTGLLASAAGPPAAVALPAAAMWLVVFAAVLGTRVWHYTGHPARDH